MAEKFWHDGLNFQCQRCDFCCTFTGGMVTATESEFHQIAEFLNLGFIQFLEQYTTEIDGYRSLKSTADGPCIFYQAGCLIYPVRPMQCQTYPFWRDILKSATRWHSAAQNCRGINCGKKWDRETIQSVLKLNKQELLRGTK
jgi:hypothetical protein